MRNKDSVIIKMSILIIHAHTDKISDPKANIKTRLVFGVKSILPSN